MQSNCLFCNRIAKFYKYFSVLICVLAVVILGVGGCLGPSAGRFTHFDGVRARGHMKTVILVGAEGGLSAEPPQELRLCR